MCSYECLFVIVIAKLIALSMHQSIAATLTGRCNECFSNGIACLDEQNFVVCIDNTTSTIRTPCPSGAVCTAAENICLATAQGSVPACYDDQCGSCSSIQSNFACLDVATYAICYDGQTPAASSINNCPEDYVCDLENTGICSSSQLKIPSCMPGITDTTTDSAVDTTTDTVTETTTVATTESSAGSISDTITGTTIATTISINTVGTNTSPADTTFASTAGTTTYTTSDTTADVTTDRITTGIETNATTDSITGSTTDQTADSTAFSTTNGTTDTTTVTTTTQGTATTANTIPKPGDANTFCADVGRKGNFRADGDTTCASYIHCYLLAGQYLGWRYTCSNFFNAATGQCQTDRPTEC